MQIILISDRLGRARTIALSLRHVFLSLTLGVVMLASLTGALYWLSLRFAVDLKIPLVTQLVLAAQQGET